MFPEMAKGCCHPQGDAISVAPFKSLDLESRAEVHAPCLHRSIESQQNCHFVTEKPSSS